MRACTGAGTGAGAAGAAGAFTTGVEVTGAGTAAAGAAGVWVGSLVVFVDPGAVFGVKAAADAVSW